MLQDLTPEQDALIIREHCRLRDVFVHLPRYGSMLLLEDVLGVLSLPEKDDLRYPQQQSWQYTRGVIIE
jgi:hypothetical protein